MNVGGEDRRVNRRLHESGVLETKHIKRKTGKKKGHSKECSFFVPILEGGAKSETISEMESGLRILHK